MIYFTNANLQAPHLTFIGRWSPFHRGHITMINAKRSEHPHLPVLLMVRDTKTENYTATERAEYIKIWMEEHNVSGTIMIVPDIEGVYWGRGVGYHVGQIQVDISTENISGTHIRRAINTTSASAWENAVASKHASYVLTTNVSKIIRHGYVIWLTGSPASGKTTIAQTLSTRLRLLYPHLKIQVLDGDDMRASPLAQAVGFSKRDRADHIRRMAYLAKMFADHGILVICAFVSPDRTVRSEVKRMIGGKRYLEVYVQASLPTRMQRDIKGLYQKAQKGTLSNLTGFNAPYEKPNRPGITCNTEIHSADACADTIINKVFYAKS